MAYVCTLVRIDQEHSTEDVGHGGALGLKLEMFHHGRNHEYV